METIEIIINEENKEKALAVMKAPSRSKLRTLTIKPNKIVLKGNPDIINAVLKEIGAE